MNEDIVVLINLSPHNIHHLSPASMDITLCRGVDPREAFHIVNLGLQQKFQSGQVLFHEGDTSNNVYEIIEGIVRLYMLMPDGRRQITRFAARGDLIGFTDALTYLNSAEAVGDTVVLSYSRPCIVRLAHDVPGVANNLLDASLCELRETQSRMLLLGQKTAIERIASFLMDLANRFCEEIHEDTVIFHIPMQQKRYGRLSGPDRRDRFARAFLAQDPWYSQTPGKRKNVSSPCESPWLYGNGPGAKIFWSVGALTIFRSWDLTSLGT